MKTPFERARIWISQLGIALVILLVIGTESRWKENVWAVEGMTFLAVTLAAIGCLGRIWCLSYISGRKDSELVTEGPYSLCRNPLYFFSFIGALGVGLATCTLAIPMIIAVCFLGLYPSIIAAEERRLLEFYGAKYQDYLQRIPRFFPSFRHYRPLTSVTINPQRFQHGLLDASYFLLAVGGAHLASKIHEFGFTTAYASLP